MSTKTLRKRIALVAASALTAGVLSVVSAPSSFAANSDGDIDNVTTSTLGLVGAVSPSLADNPSGATTRTATLLKTGQLGISTFGTATLIVSSGAIISSSTTASKVNGSQSCAAGVVDGDTTVIKPTGAAGTTFTVTAYDEDTCATAATASDVITVTIADTNKSGIATAADSTVRWDDSTCSTAPTAAEDVTNSETTTGNQLYLRMNVADAYAQDISDATGALVVTVSSGAYLGTIGTSPGSAASATTTTQVSSADPSYLCVRVGESTAGAGWNGTVTVSYNGIALATKSGKITGEASKITVSPYKIGRTGTTSAIDTHLYKVTDAAGNGLAFTSSDIAFDTSSNAAVLSSMTGGAVNASSTSAYGAYVGSLKTICVGSSAGVAGGGTSNVVVKYTLSSGKVIKSNSFVATCGGDAYTYKASLDKASYIQGEVATMTIVFSDSKGNLANSTTAVAALNDAGDASSSNATISAPMLSMVGTMGAGTGQKPGLRGHLEYKFTVGTNSGLTAGAYNAVVSFPTLSNADAVSVAYKVATGSTDVTNADVLKSIVALIASINKQIQALQKLILKK
jgi:hypothetical protein